MISQKLKCSNGRSLSTQPTESYVLISLTMGHGWGSSNMLRTVWSQGPSIQHSATRIRSQNWLVTCSTRNLDNTGGKMLQEKIHNSPETSTDGWMHSTPKLLEVTVFPSVMKITLIGMGGNQQIQLWLTPKQESYSGYVRKKMPLGDQLSIQKIFSIHIEMGRNACWKNSNTMLVRQIQYAAGKSLERKSDTGPTLITSISFSSNII